jgi:hypothetical protein
MNVIEAMNWKSKEWGSRGSATSTPWVDFQRMKESYNKTTTSRMRAKYFQVDATTSIDRHDKLR